MTRSRRRKAKAERHSAVIVGWDSIVSVSERRRFVEVFRRVLLEDVNRSRWIQGEMCSR